VLQSAASVSKRKLIAHIIACHDRDDGAQHTTSHNSKRRRANTQGQIWEQSDLAGLRTSILEIRSTPHPSPPDGGAANMVLVVCIERLPR